MKTFFELRSVLIAEMTPSEPIKRSPKGKTEKFVFHDGSNSESDKGAGARMIQNRRAPIPTTT